MYDEITDDTGLLDTKEYDEKSEIKDDNEDEYVPKFIKGEKEEIKANERGNAYHKVMELLDYTKANSIDEVAGQIERIRDNGYISKEQYETIKTKDIYAFVTSSLGQRIKVAKEKELVRCEQPFVIGISAKELFLGQINGTANTQVGKDNILIQGIIDLYFEEDDEIVLVDYKTDRVNKYDGEEVLIKRYEKQLELYKTALERTTGKKVKETLIYSFTLGKVISL
jgi:ATP-dependent helicase/nuclease subunit A